MLGNVCTVAQDNLGYLGCDSKGPFRDTVALFLAKNGFEFATFADFADKTKWEEAVKAKNIIPLKGIIEIDDQSEDAQYYESPGGIRTPAREGSYRNVYMFSLPFEVHKALRTLSNGNFQIFTLDSAGNVIGTSPDGTKVTGFTPSLFNVEKLTGATQDNTPAWSRVAVDISDVTQLNDFGVYVKTGWSLLALNNVASVGIAVISANAAEIKLSVFYVAGLAADGSALKIPITGIAQADFLFTDTAPTADAMVDNGDGTYTFPGTAMVSGTVTLVAPSAAVTVGTPIEHVDNPEVITIV